MYWHIPETRELKVGEREREFSKYIHTSDEGGDGKLPPTPTILIAICTRVPPEHHPHRITPSKAEREWSQ